MEFNLKAKLVAYSRISDSVLNQYARKDELGEMAYQDDVAVDQSGTFLRTRGKWVAGEVIYVEPQIHMFELMLVFPDGQYVGKNCIIKSVRHQELEVENIVGRMQLWYKDTLISELDPSVEDITVELNSALILEDISNTFIFKCKDKFDNIISATYTITVEEQPQYMYSKVLGDTDFDSLVDFDKISFELNKQMTFTTTFNDYIVWICTPERINGVIQIQGSIETDAGFELAKTLTFDNVEYYCYRSQELAEGNFIFKLV